MNIRIVAGAVLIFVLFIPLVLAGTVSRSFSSTSVDTDSHVTVTLDVDVVEGLEDYYAIDEIYPSGWVVTDRGWFNDSELIIYIY